VGFSLSHVAGIALIGIAKERPLGVDVERARPVRVRSPRRVQIELAAAALGNGEVLEGGADARFLQAWVRLEAFAKAEGCGIGHLLTRLGIMGDGEATRAVMLQRAARVRSESGGRIARDLDLGEGLFGAVALAPEGAAPGISWLPTSVAGLGELLAECLAVDRNGRPRQKGRGGA
jgi:4'-phosphopantetheinyl transferase